MKLRTFVWIICLLTTIFSINVSYADPPVGTWEVIGNGFAGTLVINVDPQGNVTGTIYGDPIEGFFDEPSHKIIFVRRIGGDPSIIQVWTGYLWSEGATFCAFGDIRRQIAGSFEAFASTGATPARNVFGWTAIQCIIG